MIDYIIIDSYRLSNHMMSQLISDLVFSTIDPKITKIIRCAIYWKLSKSHNKTEGNVEKMHIMTYSFVLFYLPMDTRKHIKFLKCKLILMKL